MEVISDPLSTATIMLMTKLLSHHSVDEEYINSPEHSWIQVGLSLSAAQAGLQKNRTTGSPSSETRAALQDSAALELYKQYVDRLNVAEAEMERRNQTEARLRGGKGFPYTQMMPGIDLGTAEPGEDGDIGYQVSYRGIPNSIAI